MKMRKASWGGGYPLIKSTPRSTPVSLHIHNISLHTFQSLINKTVPFHPEGEYGIFKKDKPEPETHSFIGVKETTKNKVHDKEFALQ